MDAGSRRDLEILTALAEGPPVTQRALARRLGIALGLTNLYLKRLARKGCLKIATIPPARVRYLLTPRGVAEKVRLTYEFMDYSLRLYREARQALREALAEAAREPGARVALVGTGEAAELAYVTLRELGLEPAAVFDRAPSGTFLGLVVRPLLALDPGAFDRVVVATFADAAADLAELRRRGWAPGRLLTLRSAGAPSLGRERAPRGAPEPAPGAAAGP